MAVDYYKDGAINPELVTDCAEKYAALFANARPKLNPVQLRKFYGEVKRLELRLRERSGGNTQEVAFRQILPLIKLLKAKAAYANKRQVAPVEFTRWIGENVARVNSAEDFRAFLLYFEAVVGFSE